MCWNNIFHSDFRLPERVCIVAPGPNGVGHYDKIPDDLAVIAVSKAVLIPSLCPICWMMNHIDQPWFARANASFEGVRVFHRDAVRSLESTAKSALVKHAGCFYYAPPPEPLGLEHFVPVEGCIRIGATISACAVQFAYNFGAQEIVLCGVDMSGDDYFDGTVNRNPNHGDTWPAASRLNLLINRLVKEKGLKISTLSPTKLDVSPFQR